MHLYFGPQENRITSIRHRSKVEKKNSTQKVKSVNLCKKKKKGRKERKEHSRIARVLVHVCDAVRFACSFGFLIIIIIISGSSVKL